MLVYVFGQLKQFMAAKGSYVFAGQTQIKSPLKSRDFSANRVLAGEVTDENFDPR